MPERTLQILLVDDEEPFRKVVSVVLQVKGGFFVEECESGENAIGALRQKTFDVVILDYRMEAVSGLNVLQWMLEQKIDTPVIVLTGAGSEHIAVEAMKLGAYDYIRKDLFEQQRLPLIVNGVYERYLFKKEKEHGDRISKDRERTLASVELLQSTISTSAHILKSTLANIPSEIDRYRESLQPIIQDQGHELLEKMANELKAEYNFILVITKSLSELSDLVYQRFKGMQEPMVVEGAFQSQLKTIQDKSSAQQNTEPS
ncbi:MAG TPA: response regulator [Bacteroidota bacterium]|nr:response regulator [Bacteroidota bacterium]